MEKVKFAKEGNTKLGKTMWSFNKLAGSGSVKGTLGTCGKYCKGCYNPDCPSKSPCYAVKNYGFRPSVVTGHTRNTLAMRANPEKAFAELDGYIKRAHKKPTAIRIHSSGELESQEELLFWFKLARRNPNIVFYVYTKAYDIVDGVLSKSSIPSNFYLNVSIWHEYGVDCYNHWKRRKNVRAFVYDDGYNYSFKPDAKCPAYLTGKMDHRYTCDKCKLCFSSKHKVCFCHDH